MKIFPERKVYNNKCYDKTFIEIFPQDNLNHFLEINKNDKDIEKTEHFISQNLYPLQYQVVEVDWLYPIELNYNKDYVILHKWSTENGSSGSPIILLDIIKRTELLKGNKGQKNRILEHYQNIL